MEQLHLHSSARPGIWESGGGRSNTGWARIVCGPHGEAKSPIEVRTSGPLANEDHALIPVSPGDVVIEMERTRDEYAMRARQITVCYAGRYQYRVVTAQIESDPVFQAALEAVVDKTHCYHCRSAHWAVKED